MKPYLVSVVITSVIIALSELILPQGKLRAVANTVFSVALLLSLISPIINTDGFNLSEGVFSEQISAEAADKTVISYFDGKLSDYYESEFKSKLFDENIVAEKIEVEICNTEIIKVQIFLSNLVIPEENTHININVIKNYLSEALGLDEERVEVYA